MSFFETVLSADCRTSPVTGKGEYAEAYTRQPRMIEAGRFTEHRDIGWAACILHAETVVQLAAKAVAETEMTGISGDMPDHRAAAAAILTAAAKVVRVLALDADCDAECTPESWDEALRELEEAMPW